MTPVLYFITTVLIEVYLQGYTESIRLRDIDKPTSSAEICSPSSLYLKAVKAPALTGVTSELSNSNRKKNPQKTHYSLSRKKLRTSLYNFIIFLHLKFRKRGTQSHKILQKITKVPYY